MHYISSRSRRGFRLFHRLAFFDDDDGGGGGDEAMITNIRLFKTNT